MLERQNHYYNLQLLYSLPEPRLHEEVAVQFHPLTEAMRTFKISELSYFSIGDKMDLQAQNLTGNPGMPLTTSADFTETITSLCPQTEGDTPEDFTVLTSQQIECESVLLFHLQSIVPFCINPSAPYLRFSHKILGLYNTWFFLDKICQSRSCNKLHCNTFV